MLENTREGENQTMICSCGVEIAASAKFCPHCGRHSGELVSESATSVLRVRRRTTAFSQTDLAVSQRANGTATTVTVDPCSPPLPGKFPKLLSAEMKPEAIIWDLYRHKTILRNFLESLAADWPAGVPSDALDSAIEYLQSHCVVCGKRTPPVDCVETPMCGDCDGGDS